MQIKISLRFHPSCFEWAPEPKILICGIGQLVTLVLEVGDKLWQLYGSLLGRRGLLCNRYRSVLLVSLELLGDGLGLRFVFVGLAIFSLCLLTRCGVENRFRLVGIVRLGILCRSGCCGRRLGFVGRCCFLEMS